MAPAGAGGDGGQRAVVATERFARAHYSREGRLMRRAMYVMVTAAFVAVPASLEAQTPRRQAPIEIRGQVPTPQVVTVRPREVPTYSRQVLVPEFYDRDFWQSILPAYQLIPRRQLEGVRPTDTSQVIAAQPAPVALGVPVVTQRVPGAAAAMANIDPGLPPEERARRAEIAALRAELDRRRARFDSLAARVDTLFKPGGRSRSVLDTTILRPDTARR